VLTSTEQVDVEAQIVLICKAPAHRTICITPRGS